MPARGRLTEQRVPPAPPIFRLDGTFAIAPSNRNLIGAFPPSPAPLAGRSEAHWLVGLSVRAGPGVWQGTRWPPAVPRGCCAVTAPGLPWDKARGCAPEGPGSRPATSPVLSLCSSFHYFQRLCPLSELDARDGAAFQDCPHQGCGQSASLPCLPEIPPI